MSELIPVGTHAALCRSIQPCYTENGKEQLAIGFEIQNWNEEQANDSAGRTLMYFGGFAEAQPGNKNGPYDFTMSALRNIGWKGDDLSELPEMAASNQLAEIVWLVVEHEEYKGETQAKIKWVNKPGGISYTPKKPMDANQLKAFAAGMKSRIKGSTAPAAKQSQQPARNGNGGQRDAHPNAPGGGRDDIPFATADFAADVSPIAHLLR